MTTTTYTVSGMSCAHCVAAVTDEVTKLEGVTDVAVELVAGGESKVTVTSDAVLAEQGIRQAVDDAGYVLTGTSG